MSAYSVASTEIPAVPRASAGEDGLHGIYTTRSIGTLNYG